MTAPKSSKPFFKLVDQTTKQTVLVIQAANLGEADERLSLLISLNGTARWFPVQQESENLWFEEHRPTEPICVQAYLDGYFAVLADAFLGKCTH